jgi:ABC-2 type transport system ATP-binding protein
VIELRDLSKTYRSLFANRIVRALDDLTVTLDRGEVVGIAGPNGAGKSTLISLVLGFLHPTRGTVRVDGQAPRAYVERRGAAHVPEVISLPPHWTVESTLRRAATLAAVPPGARRARVEAMLAELALDDQRHRPVRELSKGTLQRLGLAQALIGDDDLVVLDEPTHGLDPLWTQRFRELVRALRRPERVMLVASHNLDELERLADRVLILHQGRLERVVAVGATAGARDGGAPLEYRLALAAAHPALARVFPGAAAVPGRPNEWRVRGELAALNRGLSELLAAGALVVAFEPDVSGLESEFRAAVGADR